MPATDTSSMPLADRLAQLPQFYSYKDVLTLGFGDDEDGFIDAWVSGALPLNVRRACEETMSDRQMEIWLLRRLVRQFNSLLAHIGEISPR